MKTINQKQILYLLFFIFSISIASATIEDLVNSYDYSYDSGEIEIIEIADNMSDTDGDGLDDLFVVMIEVSTQSLVDLNFVAEIIDRDIILINSTSDSIDGTEITKIRFPTNTLPDNKFNYSVRIYDSENNLHYRSNLIESKSYSNFKESLFLLDIEDFNVNNDFILFNITINSTKTKPENVTLILGYNYSEISITEEKTLSEGINNFQLKLDNETIKETHYKGKYLIKTIIVGGKIIDIGTNSSHYDFEDFAKTSYIKSFIDSKLDLDENDLADFLVINSTIICKDEGAHNIIFDLTDYNGNILAKINETIFLTEGINIIPILINGTKIYNSYTDGPYQINTIILSKNNEIIDSYNPNYQTEEYLYYESEPPPLADLTVLIDTEFNENANTTELNITINNIGEKPAFHFNLDIFNNDTYEETLPIAFLDTNQNRTINKIISNTKKESLFTVLIDFDNNVDEENESNNFAFSETVSEEFLLKLYSGWNLFSVPIKGKKVIDVLGPDSTAFTLNNQNKKWIEINDNESFNTTLGYWYKSGSDEEIKIEGTKDENNLYLYDDWNLIATPVIKHLNNSELNNVSVILSYKNNTWYAYDRNLYNDISQLEPGFGYLVKK